MVKIGKLARNEKMILEALWRAEKPLTRSGILANMEGVFKQNSFYNYLNSLLDKGLVREGEVVRTGKTYGRTYLPGVTKDEYHLVQMEELDDAMNPSEETAVSFVLRMIESKDLSRESIAELEEMLERKKAELNTK